jgi:hypothetical protein
MQEWWRERRLDPAAAFGEIAPAGGVPVLSREPMNTPAGGSRRINWPNVTTVASAVILIAAEVFGAAFAGGWALAILWDLGDYGSYVLQALFIVLGVVVMIQFVRSAQRAEPFTTSE